MRNTERRWIDVREALEQFSELESCDLWERREEVIRIAERARGGDDMNKFIGYLKKAERCNAFQRALQVLMRELGAVAEAHHG